MSYTNEINNTEVPAKYIIPEDVENLDGHRLLLLEEVLEEAGRQEDM